MADDSKNTLIDLNALNYFYKCLHAAAVMIAPQTVAEASTENAGFVYYIPKNGTYAGITAKQGDYIVSDGTQWTLIPKGSEGTTYYSGTGIDISKINNKDTITNTGVTAISESTGDTNKGKINVITNGTSVDVAVHGLGTTAYTTLTSNKAEIVDNGTKVPNANAVYDYVTDEIGKLPTPMTYEGTVGTGGDYASLSAITSPTNGMTLKVISEMTVVTTEGSKTAKAGDTVIYNNKVTKWDLIPSGDEPSGTVTSVGVSVPTGLKVANSPVTTSGTIAVSLDTGYEIPTSASLVKKVNNITPTNNNVTLAGDDIATKSSTYSKATAEANITKDTKVDAAIGQLDYRTDTNKTNISKIVKTLRPDADMFVSDETAVSTKVVPQDVDKFAVVSAISGSTQKVVQLVDNGDFETNSKWSANNGTLSISSGVATLTITTKNAYQRIERTGSNAITGVITGHTYLAIATIKSSVSGEYNAKAYLSGTWSDKVNFTNTFATLSFALVAGDTDTQFGIYTEQIPVGENVQYKNVMLFDLTAMGITETEFASKFKNAYYDYTTGSLISAPIESVVSESVNLWNSKTVSDAPATGNSYKLTAGDFVTSIFECESSTKYTFSVYGTHNRFMVVEYASDPTPRNVAGTLVANNNELSTYTYTTSNTAKYIAFYINNGSLSNPQIQIVKGDGADHYSEPFKTTISVPEAIKNLPDYGVEGNYIDFENKVYHHVKSKSKFSDLTWSTMTTATSGSYRMDSKTLASVIKKASSNSDTVDVLSSEYTKTNANQSYNCITGIAIGTGGNVYVYDPSYNTNSTTNFVNDKGNVEFIYPLATEELIDISNIIPPIRVESGGTITLENEHNLDVANTIIYKKEVLA